MNRHWKAWTIGTAAAIAVSGVIVAIIVAISTLPKWAGGWVLMSAILIPFLVSCAYEHLKDKDEEWEKLRKYNDQ